MQAKPNRQAKSAQVTAPKSEAIVISLLQVFAQPELLPSLTLHSWDLVLRQARAAGLMARLAYVIEARGWGGSIPAEVQRHLSAERLLSDKLARDVERELDRMVAVLQPANITIVALKGTAYVIGELPPAPGRLFTDIDILVPHQSIDVAEKLLTAAGWHGLEKPAWDQRFYRRWMHQIPPMVHDTRESIIDLHFAIVPNAARNPVPSEPLIATAQRSRRNPAVWILSPADMILHS